MKKIVWIILPLLILSITAVSASAAQYVYDYGNILTDSEEAYLEELAESESDKYGISIVILTEDGIGGADPMMYAADFYDYGGFLDNGIILFLEMEERDWQIVNTGMLMDIVKNYELDYFADHAVSWFSMGDYKTGFEQYIIITSALLDYSINSTFTGEYALNDYHPKGSYYDDPTYGDDYYYDDSYYDDYYYDSSYGGVGKTYYVIAFGISLLIAFLVCSGFKNQLNSAVKKSGASDYFTRDSADITYSTDRFLYSRTTKMKKPDNNNSRGGSSGRSSGGSRSFSGSSGRSHSGGGGKF